MGRLSSIHRPPRPAAAGLGGLKKRNKTDSFAVLEVGQLVFFSFKIHKIELVFRDDECQQFILMEKLTFCFWLRGAILAHKECLSPLPPQNPPLDQCPQS